jgi:hypothetical protein
MSRQKVIDAARKLKSFPIPGDPKDWAEAHHTLYAAVEALDTSEEVSTAERIARWLEAQTTSRVVVATRENRNEHGTHTKSGMVLELADLADEVRRRFGEPNGPE